MFELADALLCTDRPAKALDALPSAPEHRRGYGARHDRLDHGRIEIDRFPTALSDLREPTNFCGSGRSSCGHLIRQGSAGRVEWR